MDKNKAIVIIGASELQNPLILRAKELGFTTHVFAWADGSIGEKTADHFYPISIVDKEAILTVCRKIAPMGVVSIASDLAVHTVTFVAQALGLLSNSLESARVATNKYQMRCRFQQNGIQTPGFCLVKDVSASDSIEFSFPLIVKPTDRSGSRGVTKVFSREELRDAIERCLEISFEKEAIVEEFIEGPEFSAESISFQGVHKLLAVTKKFTTGAPNFIETGHHEPSGLAPDILARIESLLPTALDSLSIEHGASHAEFKLDSDGNPRLIEIGPRMGGDCIGSDLVNLSSGYDFLKMVINVSCGIPPSFERTADGSAAFVQFVFNQDSLVLLETIRQKAPKTLHRISHIEEFDGRLVTDSSRRFGYFILCCETLRQGYDLLGWKE